MPDKLVEIKAALAAGTIPASEHPAGLYECKRCYVNGDGYIGDDGIVRHGEFVKVSVLKSIDIPWLIAEVERWRARWDSISDGIKNDIAADDWLHDRPISTVGDE